jgi:hypothetical protein
MLIVGLCYNIRYFERHGRDLKSPWSCRQTVVNQRFYFKNSLSNWTIVQPPLGFNDFLKGTNLEFDFHPLEFHLQYITLATRNWRDYLDYISANLINLVSHPIYIGIRERYHHEYLDDPSLLELR